MMVPFLINRCCCLGSRGGGGGWCEQHKTPGHSHHCLEIEVEGRDGKREEKGKLSSSIYLQDGAGRVVSIQMTR